MNLIGLREPRHRIPFSIFLLGILNQPFAFSQEPGEVVDTYELEEVTAAGYFSALAQMIEEKRSSSQIIDTISAEELGQFPDQNAAEAIARVPGVSVTRRDGEGEHVSVRGMVHTFTRVEVDGRSAMLTASARGPDRSALLSVYSPDMYSSIEVAKTHSAADVEGGIGGTVRLHTPDPLNLGSGARSIGVSFSASEYKDSVEPGFEVLYADVIEDGVSAFLVQSSYEESDRRSDHVQTLQSYRTVDGRLLADPMDPSAQELLGAFFPGRLRYSLQSGDSRRWNTSGKWQYRPSERWEIEIGGLYTLEKRETDTARLFLDWNQGRLVSGSVDPDTNNLDYAEFVGQGVQMQNSKRDSEVESKGLTATSRLFGDDWNLSVEAAVGSGTELVSMYLAHHRGRMEGPGSYDLRENAATPGMTTPLLGRSTNALPISTLEERGSRLAFDEQVVRADLEIERVWGGFESFQVGVRFADTSFDNQGGRAVAPRMKGAGDPIVFADGDTSYIFGDGRSFAFDDSEAFFPSTWATVDPRSLLAQYPTPQDLSLDGPDTYEIEESSAAGYLMGNFRTFVGEGTVSGNVGARLVSSRTSGSGNVVLFAPDRLIELGEAEGVDYDYDEVLPALNLNYSPKPDRSLVYRAAVSRGMQRPLVNHMTPTTRIDYQAGTIERGNPGLEPFLAWQYDLAVERYFGQRGEGMLALSAFAKDVENFSSPGGGEETLAFPEAGLPETTYRVRSFANGGEADIKGLEATLRSPFSFLPSEWRGFGGEVNYTYTDAKHISETGREDPFPGISKTSLNVVAYFERSGYSTRLAYAYRDDFLLIPAMRPGEGNRFVEGGGRLDLSFRYRWESGFRIALDLLNLTGESQRVYNEVDTRLEDQSFESATARLSASYRF